MNNVQRSAGDGGRSDHFAYRLDAGLDFSGATRVGVNRQPAPGGETEHVNDFQPGCAGCIRKSHSNRQSARVELGAQARSYGFDLFRRGGLIGGWAALGQDLRDARVVFRRLGGQRGSEHESTRGSVTGRCAVMDQRVAFLDSQELGDVGHTDFQLQCRGHAVKRLDALAFQFLAVLVEIDEAGGDHQSVGMNDAPSA